MTQHNSAVAPHVQGEKLYWLVTMIAIFLVFALVGCDEETPAEKAAGNVSSALEEMGESLEDAASDLSE